MKRKEIDILVYKELKLNDKTSSLHIIKDYNKLGDP